MLSSPPNLDPVHSYSQSRSPTRVTTPPRGCSCWTWFPTIADTPSNLQLNSVSFTLAFTDDSSSLQLNPVTSPPTFLHSLTRLSSQQLDPVSSPTLILTALLIHQPAAEPGFFRLRFCLHWRPFVEIIFLNDGDLHWRDFFRLHRRKWISEVTGTNTVFNVDARNRKLGPIWRRLWREQPAQKGALCLTAENNVVWRDLSSE